MKSQSRLGVTIPTNCSCNCWGSIRQETPGDAVQLFHEGCDDFEWAWYKSDGIGNFPQIAFTENDPTYTPTNPDELIAVLFTSPNCCSVMSNAKWVSS